MRVALHLGRPQGAACVGKRRPAGSRLTRRHGTASGVILFVMPDKKIVDDTNRIPDKRGNGILRREVWVDGGGKVTRYNLAYINATMHSGDNGRVVGYDNAHGYHHRHYFGGVTPVDFVDFDGMEEKFQVDWLALQKVKGKLK